MRDGRNTPRPNGGVIPLAKLAKHVGVHAIARANELFFFPRLRQMR